jgi:hypothetical protein
MWYTVEVFLDEQLKGGEMSLIAASRLAWSWLGCTTACPWLDFSFGVVMVLMRTPCNLTALYKRHIFFEIPAHPALLSQSASLLIAGEWDDDSQN